MNKDVKAIHGEFRRSPETRYIHRLHCILLVLLGLSTVKAGKLLGVPQRTVSYWVNQFRKQGLDGLCEAEKPGRPEVLSVVQKKSLSDALSNSPKKVGLDADAWTGKLVASFLHKRYGLTVSLRQCARFLRAHRDRAGA
ncbi:MAG: helix-turn-helix domain-containing protein [Verrucomicrobiota bacterium]|nr:helix-turn-helix domain-containing protein [Verrucomicrobiota bacterium]